MYIKHPTTKILTLALAIDLFRHPSNRGHICINVINSWASND